MIKEERLDSIEKFIFTQHYASVDALAENFGKSHPTIRRDLNELAAKGRIKLVRGGAMRLETPPQVESTKPVMAVLRADSDDYSDERHRVAMAAVEQINPSDTVFLCSGRTTREMCGMLKDIAPLKVVTNDLYIANELFMCPDISVMLCGGNVKTNRSTPYCCGYAAEDFVRGLRIDKLFLSCDSVKTNSGCYIYNPDEIGLMRAVLSISTRHIVMATHEKFDIDAFVSICRMDDIDILISDTGLPDETRMHLATQNLQLVCV